MNLEIINIVVNIIAIIILPVIIWTIKEINKYNRMEILTIIKEQFAKLEKMNDISRKDIAEINKLINHRDEVHELKRIQLANKLVELEKAIARIERT